MNDFMRKATLAVGLAGLMFTAAYASPTRVDITVPTLDFNSLSFDTSGFFFFGSGVGGQPYSDIYHDPQYPPSTGVTIRSTSTGSSGPRAVLGDGKTRADSDGGLDFNTDMTFEISRPADYFLTIQFDYVGTVEVTDNLSGPGSAGLHAKLDCTPFGAYCTSQSITLDHGATEITFQATAGTIDNVIIGMNHLTDTDNQPIPEPASAALAMLALGGAGVASRRRRIRSGGRC